MSPRTSTQELVGGGANTSWSPLARDDEVWAPPSDNLKPPVVTSYQPLPTHKLSWENFEKLAFWVAKEVEGSGQFHIYGKRGQAQHGIDFVGFFQDGRNPTVYQAKRQQEFSEKDLEGAVKKYADGKRPFGADRLVVAVACEATETKIVEKLSDLEKSYPDLTIELWDREALSEKVRTKAWIVDSFFGPAWTSVVGGGDIATLSKGAGIEADAILRGPILHLGLADELSKAEAEVATNPESAAGRFERIASQLEKSPFAAHAVRFRSRQAQALQEAGDLAFSVRVRLDAAWEIVDYANLQMCRGLLMDLDRMEGDLPEELARSAGMLDAVVAWRLNYGRDFDSVVDAFAELQQSDPHLGQAALVFAEEAVAYRRFECVHDQVPSLLNIASQQTQDATGQLVSARLRSCVADAMGEWGDLSSTARTVYELPTAALVHARHARFLALNKQPDRAKERYLDAIQYATEKSNYGDAADWLYALRKVHHYYDETPTPGLDDFHYYAQALQT